MKDTPPEERFLIGMEMTAAARAMVWESLSGESEEARRAAFLERFYGHELSRETIRKMVGNISAKTTGAQIPVDGGNDRTV